MQSQKRPVIEWLRGAAALAVAWFHLTNSYSAGPAQVSGSLGWLGVEAFFVVSGFVIPYSLAAMPGYGWAHFGTFMLRRVTRIEIPYLVSILLVLALAAASSMTPRFRGAVPNYDIAQIASHVLYLTPVLSYEWLQPVYWTLLYEFVFYLSMGLLFPVVGRVGQTLTASAVGIAVCTAVYVGLLPDRVLLFVAGFGVYRALQHSEMVTGLLLAAGSLAVMLWLGGAWEQPAIGAAAAIAIVVFWRIPLRDGVGVHALSFLGAISYSLYLVHVPVGGRVVNLGSRFVDGPVGEILLSLPALGVSIGFAYVFWRFVERPAIMLAKRLSNRKQSQSSVGHP